MIMSFQELSHTNTVFTYKPCFSECEELLAEVILTRVGEIVELDCNGLILSTCSLPCSSIPLQPGDHSIGIKTLYTYQPYFKYYLILIHKELFIVQKSSQSELKFQKTVNGVTEFFIIDPDDSGHAKLLVSYNGRKPLSEVNVFDSQDDSSNIKVIGNALLKIKAQVQVLDVRINVAKHVLYDKKCFLSKLSGTNSFTDGFSAFSEGIPLIRVIGSSPIEEEGTNICPIICGKPWTRVCSGSWIVGVYVENNQERTLGALELMITSSGWTLEQSVLFILEDRGPPLLSQFTPSLTLPPCSQGFILGVIKDSLLTTSRLELPLVLSYHVKGIEVMKQCYIGNIEVSAKLLLTHSNNPFQEQANISDLLSLSVQCKNIDISYKLLCDKSEIIDLLINLGFVELNDVYFICKLSSNSPFRGVIINWFTVRDKPHLRIFYRRSQQLMWLLELLCNKLSWNMVNFMLSPAVIIQQELTTLQKAFSSTSDNKIHIPIDQVQALLQCERETDIAFNF